MNENTQPYGEKHWNLQIEKLTAKMTYQNLQTFYVQSIGNK